jgi:hypothetical protein
MCQLFPKESGIALLSFPEGENARIPPRFCFADIFTRVFENGLD